MNNSNYFTQSRVSQHALIVTFAWMMAGLTITGFVSTLFITTGLYHILYSIPMLTLVLFIGQIGLVIAFTKSMYSSSAATMRALFIAYAVTLGISLTSILLYYGIGVVSLAFFTTAVYFLCLVLVGVTTKRDLSKLGTICFAALIALIITQLIMTIFNIGMYTRLISIVGLLIFTGITLWDVNRASSLLYSTEGYPVEQEKVSIFMAFQLYLDFINIFLYVLRLLGNRKN